MKIGIIGLGAVGSAASFMLSSQNIANELYLYDIKDGLANASKIDLEDSLENTNSNSKIFAVSKVEELVKCDLIVLAYTTFIEPDRTLELKANYEPLKEIINALKGFNGIYLIATNPNDSIVYYAQKLSGLDTFKVIGTGTTLDSARLKIEIANKLGISYKNINAFMLAEHGDTQFFYKSNAFVGGKNINEFNLNLDEIENRVRFKGGEIFKVKGKTEFGIGSVIARIIKAIKDDENLITPISFTQDNLAYSRLVVVGKGGIKKVLELDLNKDEKEKLEISKNYILKTINSIK